MDPHVLRELHQIIAEPLAHLFQLSLESEKLLSDWKVGNNHLFIRKEVAKPQETTDLLV